MPLPDLARHLRLPDAPGVSDAELLHRFAEHRDEAAFELLVWRHGGMVLATCRRALGQSADADDAFQVTFLALARRAGAIRAGAALPGWLHRVARRAADRMRAAAVRRCERTTGEPPEPAVEPVLPDDLGPVLDDEIDRLPEKLRHAFVLCHLEGVTNEAAAERLGCPKGTVLSRLSRAREQLRNRLTRRGVVAPALLTPTAAALTAVVAAATAHAAVSFVAGSGPVEVSSRVVAVTRDVLRSMRVAQLRPVALVLALVTVAGVGVAAVATRPTDQPPPEAPVAVRLAPVPAPPPVAPRVLDLKQHGPPIALTAQFALGGSVLVVSGSEYPNPFTVNAVTTLWDATTGKYIRTYRSTDCLDQSALSPDGKRLALHGSDKRLAAEPDQDGTPKVLIVDVATGKELVKLEGESHGELRFSPDGSLLATNSGHRLWDTATGKRVFEVKPPDGEELERCDFSRDGKLVLLTSAKNLRVWEPATKKERGIGKLAPEQGFVPGPNGTILTTGAGRPRLLSVTDGKEVQAFGPADEKFVDAAISPDAGTVIATTEAGRVVSWNATTGAELVSFEGPAGKPHLTPDGKHVVITWEEATEERTIMHHRCAVFTTNGREVRRERGVSDVSFDRAMRSVAVVTPCIPGFLDGAPDLSTVSVAVHDAVAWLKR